MLRLGLITSGLLSTTALDVQDKSLQGTETADDGLTQKQLAMLRYFAHLTYMTEQDDDMWKPWRVDGKLPNGGGGEAGSTPFGDLRYQVSNVAYAVGAVAERTPAYTEVHGKILRSASARMLDSLVWAYTHEIYPAGKTNGGSDPISWKNIMYSGHVGKVMALHETITGDLTFSEHPWTFTYKGRSTRFNLSGVMDGMYNQMFPPGGEPPAWGTWYEGGGVPCEPVMIFLLCNNFPHNAFHMHDGIHGTHYQDSDKRWQDEVRAHAVNTQPKKPQASYRGSYFKVGYMNALRAWIPDAPIEGGDSWALAWIRGWWNETDPADKELLWNGYRHLALNVGWKTDDTTAGTYHHGVPASFDFIATSFFPMIERQFWHNESGLARKSKDIMKWVEQFGAMIDTDNDGVKDSYVYAKPKDGYRDAANANLLAGMAFPNDGSSNDIFRNLFQASPPFYQLHANEPKITHAEFPAVMVNVARFDKTAGALNFQLVAGDKPMAESTVELANCQGLSSVTLDGSPFADYTVGRAGELSIRIPAVTDTPQVWRVSFKGFDVLM